MFIIQVVPLLGGTDTTMSPSRHAILCCIVSLIQGGGPAGGPFSPNSCAVALIGQPLTVAIVRPGIRSPRADASTTWRPVDVLACALTRWFRAAAAVVVGGLKSAEPAHWDRDVLVH